MRVIGIYYSFHRQQERDDNNNNNINYYFIFGDKQRVLTFVICLPDDRGNNTFITT